MVPLTDRQKLIFRFIEAHVRERGVPPSIREIGAHAGIRSTNGVIDHLNAIQRKGWIDRDAPTGKGTGRARCIRLLANSEAAEDMPAPVRIDLTGLSDAQRAKVAAFVAELRREAA